MAEPEETLIFVSRLTRGEKDTLYQQAAAFPGTDVPDRLRSAVDDVCIDRLLRAQGCLALARSLRSAVGGTPDEEWLRAAVGRAYYSLHHSIRAMALWQDQWDPAGHGESIERLRSLLQDNAFRGRSGLAGNEWARAVEARENRHVADYSPYAAQREPPSVTPIWITRQDWEVAADFNIQLAQELLDAAVRFVGS